jgi:hypothetical protein
MPVASSFRRRLLTAIVLAVLACGAYAAEAKPPVDMPSLFPGHAMAFGEVTGLGAQLGELRTSEHLAAWLASPQYERYMASPGYRKLQAVLDIAERQLGSDVWTLAKNLLAGNLAVGIYPKEGSEKPDVLVIIRTSQPTALAELRRKLDSVLVLAAEQLRASKSLAGIETLSLPNDVATLAWKDDWLAASTSRRLMDEAIKRLDGKDDDRSGGLAEDSSYQAMSKSVDWDQPESSRPSQRIFRGYLDLELLNKASGGRLIPEKLDNALASLLFGDVFELLATSPFAAATVDVDTNGLSITASVARNAEKLHDRYRAFFPAEGSGIAPPPQIADLIGGFTLYRDFAQWYVHRDELLQEQVLPGFDKFETGLANILPGRDFGEDVLPLVGKRITFVAAPQDYAHLDGEPGVKLPGMALILELAKPDEATPLLQLFFQTLAAILNLEAGQQGRQPWVVTSETYRDVQVFYAKYLEMPSGKELGIVFNFLPASARVGDRYILSSSLPLCKQLIDSTHEAVDRTNNDTPPKTALAELHFDSLAKILESDTEFFVGRMAQEGRSTEEARAEFAAILDFLHRFDSLRFGTEVSPQVFKVRLNGRWK